MKQIQKILVIIFYCIVLQNSTFFAFHIDAKCITDVIMNDVRMQLPENRRSEYFLHLCSRGLFDLEIFNKCLPRNWQRLSNERKTDLKNQIQQICANYVDHYKKFNVVYHDTKPIKTEEEDARDQRYTNFVQTLNDATREIILREGIELHDETQSNFINLTTLYPDMKQALFRASGEIETLFFIQEHIIDAILEQMAVEEESLAMAAFMEEQRHNTGLANTMAQMFGNKPQFPKNLTQNRPAKAMPAHPKGVPDNDDLANKLARAAKVANLLKKKEQATVQMQPKMNKAKHVTFVDERNTFDRHQHHTENKAKH